jgi:hypothetical protein
MLTSGDKPSGNSKVGGGGRPVPPMLLGQVRFEGEAWLWDILRVADNTPRTSSDTSYNPHRAGKGHMCDVI